MALVTVGTDATTTLTGLVWPGSIADVAALSLLIKDDLTTGNPVAQISGVGGLNYEGILSVPNRGALKIYPGDVIAVDPVTGFPILISARAAANTNWNVS